MAKILLVEDEDNIGEFVRLNLESLGHSVTRFAQAESAAQLYESGRADFDIALLDIMLPGMNGMSLCEFIRRKSDTVGIIMMSAKSQEQDKVQSLSIGADDYVTKPFGIAELVARINALLRRVSPARDKQSSADAIASGPFVLDLKSRVLRKGDKIIDLTGVEFSIMELFFRNEGVALVREKILEGAWGENYYGDIKIVDVNIRRLRMKIEDDPSKPEYIVTVWGYGYRWSV